MLKGSEILLYLSLKYNGDWEQIYDAVKIKERIKEDEIKKVNSQLNCNYITLLDNDYPSDLKKGYKPPFVLFYKGNLDLLKEELLYINGSGKSKKSVSTLLMDIIKDYPIITSLDSEEEIDAIKFAQENKQSCVIVLNCSIDEVENNTLLSSLDLSNCLILSESAFNKKSNDEYNQFKERIGCAISKKVLITSSSKDCNRLKSSVAYAIQNDKDIFVIPEQVMLNSFNNELIKQGANLLDKKEDLLI